MPDKSPKNLKKKKGQKQKNEKTVHDNQWVSTGLNQQDNRARRDGPGGEKEKN